MENFNKEELAPKIKVGFGDRYFPTFKKIFRKKLSFTSFIKWLAIIVVMLAAAIIVKDEISYQFMWYDDYLYEDDGYMGEEGDMGGCNVDGIVLRGTLLTYIPQSDYDAGGNLLYDESSADDIVYLITEAEKDSAIKAIILEIDSIGGGPTAAEEVANALKNVQKPTVALIREYGNSAAYWAATGADIIFASKNSDVGSIGVTMSYVDNAIQNEQGGMVYNQLSAGKFKDTGDPNKKLSAEEIALLMRDVNILHENFIAAVAANRNLDIEKVRALADGSSMLGEMALEKGLIDRIGGIFEVRAYLAEKIGGRVDICWY